MGISRQSETLKLCNILNPMLQFENQNKLSNTKKMPKYTKAHLWKLFKLHFENITGKQFEKSNNSLSNVSLLFYYFMRNEAFFTHPNLRKDLSIPNFKKGLLIIGGYGVGKTTLMKSLERCFIQLKHNRFKIYSTNSLVQEFENAVNPNDKSSFFSKMQLGVNLYDDLTTERIASNFGYVDIMKEIVEERYMNNKLTHATANYKEGHEGNIEQALTNLGERYGSRFYDRLFDMFNIIEFKGKSMRR